MSVLSYPRFHLRVFFYVLSATLVAFVIVCYLHSVSSLFWYLLLVLLHRFYMPVSQSAECWCIRRPIKSWLLVYCQWRFDWSFARLRAAVIVTVIQHPCCSKIQIIMAFWHQLTLVILEKLLLTIHDWVIAYFRISEWRTSAILDFHIFTIFAKDSNLHLFLCHHAKFDEDRMMHGWVIAYLQFSKWWPSAILDLVWHHSGPPTTCVWWS